MNQASAEPRTYYIVSTLTARQYQKLHGGNAAMSVEPIKSWMCSGYTGRMKDICADEIGKVYPRGPFPDPESI